MSFPNAQMIGGVDERVIRRADVRAENLQKIRKHMNHIMESDYYTGLGT
jgi:hypothetical protein